MSNDPDAEARNRDCPIPRAHRRLDEVHRLWHQTAEHYADADGFRTNLNAAIQALRSVTWLLQKEKRAIPDFDGWYEGWQSKMGKDEVLRWLASPATGS